MDQRAAASSKAPKANTIKEKAAEEMREFLLLAAYLFVCFAALIAFKTTILRDAGIPFAPIGIAAVKALILAKFVLIGRAMHLGRRFETRPLAWATSYRSLIFLILLVAFTVIEEAVVGLIHGRTIMDSLAGLGGGTWDQLAATVFLMLLILIPYFAVSVLGERIGTGRLLRAFFVDPNAVGGAVSQEAD